MSKQTPSPASELSLVEGAERVGVPHNGYEYVCPRCEEPIPNMRVVFLAKPPRWAHLLNDVIRCPCRFVFSPKSEAVVFRQ